MNCISTVIVTVVTVYGFKKKAHLYANVQLTSLPYSKGLFTWKWDRTPGR